MNKADIGFFEELQGVLANRRQPTKRIKGEEKAKTPRPKKQASLLVLSNLATKPNPCEGCPNESKVRLMLGAGNVETAKLLIVVDRVTEQEVIQGSLEAGRRFQTFWPLLKEEGFVADDIYWVAITRCPGQENLEAAQNCVEYLRRDILRENIKSILLIGLKPFQLLIDKERQSVFYARGKIFHILDKPCLVTFEKFD